VFVFLNHICFGILIEWLNFFYCFLFFSYSYFINLEIFPKLFINFPTHCAAFNVVGCSHQSLVHYLCNLYSKRNALRRVRVWVGGEVGGEMCGKSVLGGVLVGRSLGGYGAGHSEPKRVPLGGGTSTSSATELSSVARTAFKWRWRCWSTVFTGKRWRSCIGFLEIGRGSYWNCNSLL